MNYRPQARPHAIQLSFQDKPGPVQEISVFHVRQTTTLEEKHEQSKSSS